MRNLGTRSELIRLGTPSELISIGRKTRFRYSPQIFRYATKTYRAKSIFHVSLDVFQALCSFLHSVFV